MTLALRDQGVYSSTGTCKTFDAAADGYARGEAINAVYVKKLSHAMQDGDNIRAIIRGTASNCDGHTKGITTPSPTAQETLIRHAYKEAGIDVSKTAMVECHGTGTPVGDPLETAAVSNCFGNEGVVITSVKPNVGHSEGAAGLTSVIKAILALEHRQIPPNINFSSPNPRIPFDECKLHVPTEVEQWPEGRAERISVNSFGIGGSNAHVILDSARPINPKEPSYDGVSLPRLLLFSAYNATSLEKSIESHKEYMKKTNASLQDLAYSLANRRQHKPHRTYAITGSMSSLEPSPPAAVDSSATPRVIFIFTGQGAQWPGMGTELINTNATFRATIKRLDAFLRSLPSAPPWAIEEELQKPADASHVYKAEVGHAVSMAVQIALVDVLHSWGLAPDAVLGHSAGETSAAYACGAISAEGALAASAFRGIGHQSSRKGSMAAVGLGPHEVAQYIDSDPGVVIACENSHCSVTLSGDTEQVERAIKKIQQERPGTLTRFLRVEKAFHSHHMWEYGPLYEEHLQSFVHSETPKVPFYSSVSGRLHTGKNSLGPSYWRQNMEGRVRFNDALRAALNGQDSKRAILVEIGPHPALKAPIGQILRDMSRPDVHLSTLERQQNDVECLLHLAGRFYQEGINMAFPDICPPGTFLSDLPLYPWKTDTSHWEESRISRQWRFREYPSHELLGSRAFEIASEPCWRNMLALDDVPWLAGHEINHEIIFPVAGYIAMTGEALRQETGCTASYSLRNIRITSAMVLESSRITEITTKLAPIITDNSKEPRYEFVISSFNGEKWVTNCSGEARVFFKLIPPPSFECRALPRKVDETTWYRTLTRQGYHYTGLFQGMHEISAATCEGKAVARLPTHVESGKYPIHPSSIDLCFQLFTVSAYRGLGRNCHITAVPTYIKQVDITATHDKDLYVSADIGTFDRGAWTGDLTGQSSGQTVISVHGFKASAIAGDESKDPPIITQSEWKPHAEMIDLHDYMHPRQPYPKEWSLLERLVILCAVDHCKEIELGASTSTPEHLSKHLNWMNAHVNTYESWSNPFLSAEPSYWDTSHEQRLKIIHDITATLSPSKCSVVSRAISRLFHQAPNLFRGDTHALHVLLDDGLLGEFYDFADKLDYSDFIRALGHTNPHLRVLEVGAGTGGTTSNVLQALRPSHGERLYSSYTFTDISTGFMSAAKQRFSDVESLEFAGLDVSRDPIEQGFERGAYDLILGSNVVHATPSLQASLRNLRSLLSPRGRLFLVELSADAKFINYIMGFLPGWWLGGPDGRASEPYVSPERWSKELRAAGYEAPDAVVPDSIPPYHLSAGIVASPSGSNSASAPQRVTLLVISLAGPLVQECRKCLETKGVSVDVCVLGQGLPVNQDIIGLFDLEEPTLHEMTETRFRIIIESLKAQHGKMLWVTRSSQVTCEDPRYAMTLGLARTARNELPLRLFTVEIDNTSLTTAKALVTVFFQINRPNSQSMNPDWEYAIKDGQVLIPRLHWEIMSQATAESDCNRSPMKYLTMKTPGLLHSMKWAEKQITAPNGNEVLIQTKAVGLNFKDVLIAMGVLEQSLDNLGLEGCGIVQDVGPQVRHLACGDRVMYISSSSFATYVKVQECSCIKIYDESLSSEDVAALPSVYATAVVALIEKANLQRGQIVLIHSACGGVGLAAVQLAQMIGSHIYCTVGNEEKTCYLIDNCGIPRSHIFDSRDTSFQRDIMEATNKQGVDVVLNSLSGDLLQASWDCVAEFGVMVEIGKRDFQRRSKLPMEAFEANRTFIGLDLDTLNQRQPEHVSRILTRCLERIRSGDIRPTPIASRFPAERVQDGFRFMQNGRHIGKIVITMPENPISLKSTPISRPTFRSDHSYLLVGGLGGLGRVVATWMVENNARHLIFLSRSAQSPESHDVLEDLRSQGCETQAVTGSVANSVDVEKAVKSASKPIAGVINMSLVLKDVSLSDMTFLDWKAAVEPKVHGTWNLHNALLESPLDFFILFSSLAGIFGELGQANYASANTFLDAFVKYRQSNGLPASVVDLGLVRDAGVVSRSPALLKNLTRSMYSLSERDVLEAMVLAIRQSTPRPSSHYKNPSQIMLGLHTPEPITSPSNEALWKHDPRMSIYHNIHSSKDSSSTQSASRSNGLEALPADLSEENTSKKIAQSIGSALSRLLIKDEESIKLEDSPEAIGVDSLVAMEVRNWIRQQLHVDSSVFTITQSPSLLQLGEHVRQVLLAQAEK